MQRKFNIEDKMEPQEKMPILQEQLKFIGNYRCIETGSLYVNIIYEILQICLKLNQFDEKLFKEFLSYKNNQVHFLLGEKNKDYYVNLYDQNVENLCRVIRSEHVDSRDLVFRYLFHFLKDKKDSKDYKGYLTESYLQQTFAQIKIYNGDTSFQDLYQKYSNLEELYNKVILQLSPKNKLKIKEGEQAKVYIEVKNVQQIDVKLFKIDLENYYKKNNAQFKTDIDLDGLLSSHSHQLEYSQFKNYQWHEDEISLPFIDQNQRGIFVVEILGGGKAVRAVIKKGSLRHLTQYVNGGQIVSILDENGDAIVNDLGLWVEDKFYPSQNGSIFIPYTKSPRTVISIIVHRDYAELISNFKIEGEQYELNIGFLCPKEQFQTNNVATLLIKPDLNIHGQRLPLSLLKESKVKIEFRDQDGVVTSKLYTFQKIQDFQELSLNFQVPPKLASVNAVFTCRVWNTVQDQFQDFQKAFGLQINQNLKSDTLYDCFLRQNANGTYTLQVIGRNGEPWRNIALMFTFYHRDLINNNNQATLEKQQLQTDEQGQVYLGTLNKIISFYVEGLVRQQFDIQNWNTEIKAQYPSKVIKIEGDNIEIAYDLKISKPDNIYPEVSLLRMCQSNNGLVLETLDNKNHIVFVPDSNKSNIGKIKLTLQEGSYKLNLNYLQHSVVIEVLNGRYWSDFILTKGKAIRYNQVLSNLRISAVNQDQNSLNIQLKDFDQDCRVHIWTCPFFPKDMNAFDQLHKTFDPIEFTQTFSEVKNIYLPVRVLGEEYQYVLDRRNQPRFMGTTLQHPQLVLKRLFQRDTTTDVQQAKEGEAVKKEAYQSDHFGARASAVPRAQAAVQREKTTPNSDFLLIFGKQLSNLRPDQNGVVQVALDNLPQYSNIFILAVQATKCVQKVVYCEKQDDLMKKQLVLPQPHALDQVFCEKKQAHTFLQGQSVSIQDVTSAKYQIIDSLSKVYRILIVKNSGLMQWSFLTQWQEFSKEEKCKYLDEFGSHELHVFLKFKDPNFYTEVVKPYLACKIEKTVVDFWLLDQDTSEFLRPSKFQQLNVFEQFIVVLGKPEVWGNFLASLNERVKKMQAQQRDSYIDQVLDFTFDDQKASAPKLPQPFSELKSSAPQMRQMQMAKTSKVHGCLAQEEQVDLLGLSEEMGSQAMAYQQLAEIQKLYQEPGKAKKYEETQYYKLSGNKFTNQVNVNEFWLDFINHVISTQSTKNFLSSNFIQMTSLTDCILALSFLDVEFGPNIDHQMTPLEPSGIEIKFVSNSLIYSSQIGQTQIDEHARSILLAMRYQDPQDLFSYDQNGNKVEKYVSQFLPRKIYICKIIVTNISMSTQEVSILVQTPQGSIPLSPLDYSRTIHMQLNSFVTNTFNIKFYFPEIGEYNHYPVSANQQGIVIAKAQEQSVLKVMNVLPVPEHKSLSYILATGTKEDILKFIQEEDILDTEKTKFKFEDILWLCKQDKQWWLDLLEILRQRCIFDRQVWGFALYHLDKQALKEYLGFLAPEKANQIGYYFKSQFMEISPEMLGFRILEYAPLVNARAHQLGQERKVMNQEMKQQYVKFLQVICEKPKSHINQFDHLLNIYYLLLQDRKEEALQHANKINLVEQIFTNIQTDALLVYLDLTGALTQDFSIAGQIVNKYIDHPVKVWRDFFKDVHDQLDERLREEVIQEVQAVQVKTLESSLDAQILDNEIKIECKGAQSLDIQYHALDLEVQFSMNPLSFISNQAVPDLPPIKPTLIERVPLSTLEFQQIMHPIPENVRSLDTIIIIKAGENCKTLTNLSKTLELLVAQNQGYVQAIDVQQQKPVSKCYIKVYAEYSSGKVEFYKDGYTDFRGYFDYVSLNLSGLNDVKRFSILALKRGLGGKVKEAKPPSM